jgi:hypothetical protein
VNFAGSHAAEICASTKIDKPAEQLAAEPQ